jgi:hypothetical protein
MLEGLCASTLFFINYLRSMGVEVVSPCGRGAGVVSPHGRGAGVAGPCGGGLWVAGPRGRGWLVGVRLTMMLTGPDRWGSTTMLTGPDRWGRLLCWLDLIGGARLPC